MIHIDKTDLASALELSHIMVRLFVQDRNTTQQYNKQEIRKKKKKKLDKRNVREVPKQTFVNMPLGLIKCNINFIKKLLTVFLITRNFR